MEKVAKKVMDEGAEQYWKGDLERTKAGLIILRGALNDMVKVAVLPADLDAKEDATIALVNSDFIHVFMNGAMFTINAICCCLEKAESRFDELLKQERVEERMGEVGRERAERLREAAMKALEAAEEDGCASTPGNRRMAATLRKGLGFPLLEWQEEEDVLQ